MSLEPQKSKLAALLRDYRDQHNLTGRALAKKLGLNPTSLMNYLDEVGYPGPETREKIARGLGLTPPELESYLNNFDLKPLQPLEQIKQDIRSLSPSEFLEVARTVFDRLERDLHARTEPVR